MENRTVPVASDSLTIRGTLDDSLSDLHATATSFGGATRR